MYLHASGFISVSHFPIPTCLSDSLFIVTFILMTIAWFHLLI